MIPCQSLLVQLIHKAQGPETKVLMEQLMLRQAGYPGVVRMFESSC